MTGFFIKKAFFDGWDHLFTLFLMNLGFVALIALGLLVPGAAGAPAWLGIAIGLAAFLALAIWWSTCAFALVAVADYGSVAFGDLLPAFRKAWLPGLQLGLIGAGAGFLLSIGLPFYLSRGGIAGALAAGVLFWCAVILCLALQYYVPLRARLGGGLRKNLRKSLILFFDNPFFSAFLFLYNLLSLVLSFFLALLLPGFAGMALAGDVALRLRLYKYDWLEANPGSKRGEIPWDELLAEDRELVGPRTLKGMIFPWKE
ncbi:MAG TPA: hypothetical protein PLB91_05150 [Spirochaetales bacterium]|nr:hypothetical protein [Spirochaetales bacterium]HRY55666.1 hypothetical protein [Spirochaetia bacterium]HRZ66209.1 hypothetical protein [Spirochaetia bacterium]